MSARTCLKIGPLTTRWAIDDVLNAVVSTARGGQPMSRANTLYMTIRFAGGAIGATLGNYAWSVWHWPGVCGVGLVFASASMLPQLIPAFGQRPLAGKRERSADHRGREAR